MPLSVLFLPRALYCATNRGHSTEREREREREMEEISSSSPPSTTIRNRDQETSATSSMKQDCLFFTVSLQEGLRHVKAFLVGQAKKLTARNEKEATEADLQTAKMQVEATDHAENAKNKLNKSV